MTAVIDVGCASHGWQGGPTGTESIVALVDAYKPERLIGFDPLAEDREYELNGTHVREWRAAAWLHEGQVTFEERGIGSRVATGGRWVPCIDFSAWLDEHFADGDKPVVKIDIEGAEYPLLERMISDGTDGLVSELLIEWHGGGDRDEYLSRLRCPVREWWM